MRLVLNRRGYEQLMADGHILAEDEFCYTRDHKDIVFRCRKLNRYCMVPINYFGPADHAKTKHGHCASEDAPTISPSIACDHRCGWHGTIIQGEIQP